MSKWRRMLARPGDDHPSTNGHYASELQSPSRAECLLYNGDTAVYDTQLRTIVLADILC
jgi:hypothetical protein